MAVVRPLNTSLPPHLFSSYSDFAKTALTISVTSIGILVTFSSSIIDIPDKTWVVVFASLALLCLLTTAWFAILVIGLITKATRGLKQNVVSDVSRLLNAGYWSLLLAAIFFILAGVARVESRGAITTPLVSLGKTLEDVTSLPVAQCGPPADHQLLAVDLSPDKQSWIAHFTAQCQEAKTMQERHFALIVDVSSGQIRNIHPE